MHDLVFTNKRAFNLTTISQEKDGRKKNTTVSKVLQRFNIIVGKFPPHVCKLIEMMTPSLKQFKTTKL